MFKPNIITDSVATGSSTTDAPSACHRWLVKLGWLLPVLTVLAVYWVAFNNYFCFDDFIWLNRGRSFKQDWLQIFRPDVTYFDPLVYLMFAADSLIGGLDHRWYHGVDLTIHAINALLLYRFARLLTGDEKAALYGGILFAGSFAIADAVLWSSSRVDLLSTLCSLGALIQFLHYLRSDKKRDLFLSFLMFILALGAKGTPLVLPGILLWLIVQERKPLRHALCLIPFGVVILIYFGLLKLNMHQASLPLDRFHFNLKNLVVSFCALFIPEATLKYQELYLVFSLLFLAVTAAGLLAIPRTATVPLRRTGYCILVMALLPVLVVTDFKLLGEYSNPYLLLLSPSHRIYLASVGAALLGGGFLAFLETLLAKVVPRYAVVAVVIVLAVVVTANAYLVRERDRIWEPVGDSCRTAFEALLPYRHKVPEGSQLGLIYFPGSRGFLTPLAQVALGINDVSLIKTVILGMIQDQAVLQKAEKTFLFVLRSDGHLYDKTQMFRQQLLLNRMALRHPDRPEYASECIALGEKINREIE